MSIFIGSDVKSVMVFGGPPKHETIIDKLKKTTINNHDLFFDRLPKNVFKLLSFKYILKTTQDCKYWNWADFIRLWVTSEKLRNIINYDELMPLIYHSEFDKSTEYVKCVCGKTYTSIHNMTVTFNMSHGHLKDCLWKYSDQAKKIKNKFLTF